MGILLVYYVTDESSFNNIRNWIRNIEQHALDNVNKILVKAIKLTWTRARGLFQLHGVKLWQMSLVLSFLKLVPKKT